MQAGMQPAAAVESELQQGAASPAWMSVALPLHHWTRIIGIGGMNESHAASKEPDTRVVTF